MRWPVDHALRLAASLARTCLSFFSCLFFRILFLAALTCCSRAATLPSKAATSHAFSWDRDPDTEAGAPTDDAAAADTDTDVDADADEDDDDDDWAVVFVFRFPMDMTEAPVLP